MFAAALPVLELQYVDETGTKGTLTVKYPLGTTYATLDAEASLLASLVAPLTGCVLIRQRIIYKAVETPKPVPDVGSTIYRQGVFIFEDDSGVNQTLVAAPGILDSVLDTTGPGAGVLIDLSNLDIAVFISTFIATGMVNPFGVVCDNIIAAYRQSRA